MRATEALKSLLPSADASIIPPTDSQAVATMQPGDRALVHVAKDAQAGAVSLNSFGDHRADAAGPQQVTES